MYILKKNLAQNIYRYERYKIFLTFFQILVLKACLISTLIFLSVQAYRKWVYIHGEEPLLPGVNLTHDQLFFLNYAQIWCGSMRPEDALTKIRSSVHSPGSVRVLGPLSNSEDFAKAFNCPLGSPMNPKKKCNVW